MELRQQSIQGTAKNSLTGPYQEHPGSGKAGLVNPIAPVAHELMTQRLSKETSMLQNHDPRSKHTTFVSTNPSTQSWTSIDIFFNVQCAKTQKPDNIDLDRPLPPTPISDSPHLSPVAVSFNSAMASRRGSDEVDARSAAVQSVIDVTGHVTSPPTHPNAWQRRLAHSSHASMDMEIVIPPGLSEVEIIRPLNVAKKKSEGCRGGNFF